jgi:hypothetical protein
MGVPKDHWPPRTDIVDQLAAIFCLEPRALGALYEYELTPPAIYFFASVNRFIRDLRGKNIRNEKVPQLGQFFDLLRRIVGLRNEKDRENGQLVVLSQ